MDLEIFAQNVKKYCAQQGVPPTVACRESGAGSNFMVNIKNGSAPSIERVYLLAQYLGCTVSDLLGETPPEDVELPDEMTRQFLKLFSQLSDKSRNEVIAEMLKRKK